MTGVQHLAGQTFHGRRGGVANTFRYRVDYVLLNPETGRGPWLFSRDRANLTGIRTTDHGGPAGQGRGADWVREVLAANGLPAPHQVSLLAQPRVLGHVFNPVAFWLCHDAAGALRVVIAEVSNTYGERHSYLCHRDDCGPITAQDHLGARKIFHVSPFQPVAGSYDFRFDIQPGRIGIFIDFSAGANGLYATLSGSLRPLTNARILSMLLRRPFGSRRVLALIHWQALKLWLKGAGFRARPLPPKHEVSR